MLPLNNIVIIFFVFLTALRLYAVETISEQLQQELQQENITLATAAAIEMIALRNPDLLPARYQHLERPEVTRKTTLLKAIIARHWQEYSESEKTLLSPFFMRPSADLLPESIVSPKGRFKVHYTTEGLYATTPEFAREAATSFEFAYDYQVGQLGFRPPPADFGIDGPEHDIYIQNIPDYGSTTYENVVPATARQDYTGWVEIDNDFTHTPTKGYDALHVTAAHEFFHLVQLGYRSYHVTDMSAIFLFEAGATWMEDMVYDEVNDYYYYLPPFFQHPSQPFYVSNGIHEYGLSVFYHMLEQQHGIEVIKSIWENFIHYEPVVAIDQAVRRYGGTFAHKLIDFSIWNTHTGAYADTVHYYAEGRHYPELKGDDRFDLYDKIEISNENAELVVKYFELVPASAAGFMVTPVFEEPTNDYVVIQTDNLSPLYQYGAGDVNLDFYTNKDSVRTWLNIVNAEIPPSSFSVNKSHYTILVERGKSANESSKISSVVPNPFNPVEDHFLTLEYILQSTTNNLKFMVFQETGQLVFNQSYGKRPGGYGMIQWDGRNMNGKAVASGVYFLFLIGDKRIKPSKVAIIN
jgi:hypothetical protein